MGIFRLKDKVRVVEGKRGDDGRRGVSHCHRFPAVGGISVVFGTLGLGPVF